MSAPPPIDRSGTGPDRPEATLWSAEAALLVRPFKTYRQLATRRSDRTIRDLGRGILIQTVLLGGFVSLTTAGRLVFSHMIFTALFWAFLPALQIACVAAAVRVAAPREKIVPALSLYFDGMGPWYVFFLVLPAICLLAPDVYAAMSALLRLGILPLYLLATIVWGMVITWAFFREGLAVPRGRSLAGAAVHYAVFVAVVLGWYLANNVIQPQIVGTHA